jgi:hypothetical protein
MVASGPLRVRTPGTWGLGQMTTSGSPAVGAFVVGRGRAPAGRLCQVEGARVPRGRHPLAGSRRTSAKARRGRPTRFPPAFLRKPAPAPAASALLPGARAKVGPRSWRGRIREGQPSRSALARARRLTAAQRWRAVVIPPAPADNEPKQARPSGWRVDDIVVTCSDPAQWCRAAPAAALGEPVSPSGRGGFHGRARSARPDR